MVRRADAIAVSRQDAGQPESSSRRKVQRHAKANRPPADTAAPAAHGLLCAACGDVLRDRGETLSRTGVGYNRDTVTSLRRRQQLKKAVHDDGPGITGGNSPLVDIKHHQFAAGGPEAGRITVTAARVLTVESITD